MRRAVLAVMLLGLLAPPARAQPAAEGGPAAAGPRTSSLGWIRLPGAEGCVGSRELAEAVEARLGRPVFVSAADAEMAVEGRAEPGEAAGTWRATLAVSDGGGEVLGERELVAEGETCGALTEPLVLVIAILIDPEAALAGPAETEGDRDGPADAEREVEVREVVRTERVEVPVVVEREAPRWQVVIGGGAGVAWGTVPGAALLVAGAVHVTPPGLVGIELEGGLLLQASPTDTADGEARFGAAFVGVALCPLSWEPGSLSVAACLGADAGAVRGPASADQDDEQVIVELLARARVGLRVASWLSILARPTVTVPLRRAGLEYTAASGETRTLFEPWPVGVRLELGAAFHLL